MSKQPITHSLDSPENLLPYAQELVNSSLQGILAFDKECRYTIWNPAMERISGFSSKEVLGKVAFQVFPFLKQTGHDFYFYETLKGNTPISPETLYRTDKGKEGFFEGRYFPIRNEAGEVTGGFALILDVTERKKAEEALRNSEATLRAIFNSGTQHTVMINAEGAIQAFNKSAQAVFLAAVGEELEIGRPFLDYVRPEDRDQALQRLQSALSGQVVRRESPYRYSDGTEHWAEYSYNPIFDDKGSVTGVCFVSTSIDDRKKAEEALRRSEADLRAVFNSGSQVTVLIGGDGRIKGYNKSAQKMAPLVLGKDLKIGMLFTETFPSGASLEVFQKSFLAAIEGRETKGERPIRSADGKERWVEVSYQGVFNHEGGVDGVCFSLTFIDERKKAEEALRHSEMDLRAVFNSGSQVTVLIGRDGRIRAFNQAAAESSWKTMNLKQEVGRLFTDYIPMGNLEFFRQNFAAALSGKVSKGERSFIGVDGQERWVEAGYYPVFNERNEVEGVCFSSVFIDERKRAENALRESEERYRRLVESSPESLLVHSEGKIAYMNPAGVKLLGATGLEQLTGKSILDIIHPDYRELVLARVRRLDTERKQNEPLEQKFIGLDGRVIDVEVTGIPFLYQGKAAGLAIIRDITDHKKTQGMLLRYERLAAVGKVIAAIAHEIRNPLSMLTGMSQILKAKLESRNEFSQEITTILAQAERLRLFVNDILDYSREMEMKKKEVDARLLMEQSLTAAQAQIGPTHATLQVKWEWDRTLPPLWGDPDRLEQVLVNLLMNAMQSMKEDGTLTLSGRARDGFVLLGVKDNGPGINEADLPRLFEPFFTTKKQGSGLGLPISQKIAEAHGGKIEVQRIQPHGTLCTLQLPLSKT